MTKKGNHKKGFFLLDLMRALGDDIAIITVFISVFLFFSFFLFYNLNRNLSAIYKNRIFSDGSWTSFKV